MSIVQVAFCISYTRVGLFESRVEEKAGGKETVAMPSDVFLTVIFTPCLTILSCLLRKVIGLQFMEQLFKHLKDCIVWVGGYFVKER